MTGKRLIQLDGIQVIKLPTSTAKRPLRGGHRSNAHMGGVNARLACRNDLRNGFKTVSLARHFAGNQDGPRAVIEAR